MPVCLSQIMRQRQQASSSASATKSIHRRVCLYVIRLVATCLQAFWLYFPLVWPHHADYSYIFVRKIQVVTSLG